MCGRFTLSQSAEALAQAFQIQSLPDLEQQYNIAPTQVVAAVLYNSGQQAGISAVTLGINSVVGKRYRDRGEAY